MRVAMTVNGTEYARDVEPRLLLIHFLRDELGLTGSHWGCDTSNCGSCVVWLDAKPVKSCTLLAEIRVPLRPGTGSAYEKVSRRVGDWSIAAAGAVLCLAGHQILQAGLGLTAVGAEHFVAAEAEDYLRGRAADEASFQAAGAIAAEHCHPVADQRGPEDFKRHLVAELTTRALRRAADRART